MLSAPEIIRMSRQTAGLTQAELGRRLGMSQAAVAQAESPASNPTVDTLARILHATGHQLDLNATPYSPGVDETLIAHQLRMSPSQRLAAHESAYEEMRKLAGAVRKQSRGRGARHA